MRETAHLIDSDDKLRRHRLDDVARPLTCHVVTSIAIVVHWDGDIVVRAVFFMCMYRLLLRGACF